MNADSQNRPETFFSRDDAIEAKIQAVANEPSWRRWNITMAAIWAITLAIVACEVWPTLQAIRNTPWP
jgi:hypothetical protein